MNDGRRFRTVSKQRHSLRGLPSGEFELEIALDLHPHGLAVSANHFNDHVLPLPWDLKPVAVALSAVFYQFAVLAAPEQVIAIENEPNPALGLGAEHEQAVFRLRGVNGLLADGAVDLAQVGRSQRQRSQL